MNEPLINPWIFYWIDVIENAGCIFALFLFMSGFGSYYYYREASDAYREEKKERYEGKCIKCIIITLIMALLLVLIPSKETMYKMLIASQVTPHNLQVSQEVADDLLDNIEERAVKLIQEVKK